MLSAADSRPRRPNLRLGTGEGRTTVAVALGAPFVFPRAAPVASRPRGAPRAKVPHPSRSHGTTSLGRGQHASARPSPAAQGPGPGQAARGPELDAEIGPAFAQVQSTAATL